MKNAGAIVTLIFSTFIMAFTLTSMNKSMDTRNGNYKNNNDKCKKYLLHTANIIPDYYGLTSQILDK